MKQRKQHPKVVAFPDPAHREILQRHQEERGVSFSDLVREALAKLLKEPTLRDVNRPGNPQLVKRAKSKDPAPKEAASVGKPKQVKN